MAQTASFETIRYEVEDHILTITLNRPDKMNAFTHAMQSELIAAFDAADADDDVRAIIVTGAGRAFCAGADLSAGGATFDRAARTDRKTAPLRPDGEVEWSDEAVRDGGGHVTLRIFRCLKPVIGAINGAAVGIGVTMQLAMDIRIASEAARFGFVFARRGIVPEAASSWFLPRLVGIQQALEWCYTGRVFPAQEALEGRLVSKVVPADELMPAARALAREIGSAEEWIPGAYGPNVYEQLTLSLDAELIAALEAGEGTDLSASYFRALFDRYADRFDQDLVGKLGYTAPELLRSAVDRVAPAAAGLRILDLGCGTGLAGVAFKPLASLLAGVDLSPRMVEKARQRRLYDELTVGDVVEAMERAPGGWDLLVAADVLVYIGDLVPVFAAAARALPPGGYFAATVERLPGEPAAPAGATFALGPTRRYAHSEPYVRVTAEAAGFLIRLMEPCSPRREKGIPVPGLLFVAERAAR